MTPGQALLDLTCDGDWTYAVVLRRDLAREVVNQTLRQDLLRLVQNEGKHRDRDQAGAKSRSPAHRERAQQHQRIKSDRQ